jgi:hypothetical protein
MKRFGRDASSPFDGGSARMFVWPFEMMLRFNANMANALHESTVAWAERRQEAAEQTADAFERLVQSRDLVEAVTIHQEWLENSIRRLDEDVNAAANQGTKIARGATSTAKEGIQRTSDATRAGAQHAEDLPEAAREHAEKPKEGGETSNNGRHSNNGKHSRHREHGKRAA